MLSVEKICGMNMNFQYFTFDFFLDSMEKLGIKNLELWGGAPHLYVEDLEDADIVEIKKKINDRGMNTVFYTPEGLFYPYNLASEQEKMRLRTLDFYKRSMHAAALLGANNMLLVAGRGYYDKPTDGAWERSVKSLKELAKEAEDTGIGLVLEPLQFEEANLVWNLETDRKMLEALPGEVFGTMIDTVQMVSAGDTIDQYFNTFGEKVRHIHLTEGNPTGHLTWGDGKLPLVEFLRAIEKNKYEGYMTLEIGPYLMDPFSAWEQGVRTVKKTLDQMMEK